jgi:peroxiredoxin
MKQLTLATILLMFLYASCQNNKTFSITGVVPNTDSGAVRLLESGGSFLDSKEYKLKNNHFEFEGTLDFPEKFALIYEENGPKGTYKAFRFFIDPGLKIKIVLYPDSVESSEIKGGKTDQEFRKVQSILDKEYLSRMTDLMNLYNLSTNDSLKQDSILKIGEKINVEIQNWKLGYIKSNPSSMISTNLLYELLFHIPDKTVEDHFKLLDKNYSKSRYYKSIEKYLSILPGNHFIDFTLADSSRINRKFSDLAENKVTLIDFWASWCKPCRVQNESLVKIYDHFKNQGFEIVGVSIDRDTSLFKSTIVEDKMTWVNLIDIISQESVSKTYRSNTIPANFLIDNKGIIIAKDVPVDKLYSKLDSLLKL